VSSIEPNDSGGQINGAQEVARGLVVAHSNGAVLLEPDKVTPFSIDDMP
jgi:hypothetical protein